MGACEVQQMLKSVAIRKQPGISLDRGCQASYNRSLA